MTQYDFGYEVKDEVATITFDRPKVLNALTLEIYAQFQDLLEDLKHEDSVKVLIITGKGRGFSSGGDVHTIIGELFERDMRGHLEFTRMTAAVIGNMRLLDKPIIAAINGLAAGAGAVIALAADLRVMSAEAKFAFLFTRVGLTGADMGAGYLLPRIVGTGRALEILMLGDDIDAATALAIGLANRVVPTEAVMATAKELATRLVQGPSFAIEMTKRMVNNEWNMDLLSALEAEAQAQALLLMGEDHRRFYEAFKEKQKPDFIGR